MKKIFVGLILLMVIGCINQTNHKRTITVDADKIQDRISASAIFDSILYVPLETNDSSIFKDINKLCIDTHGNIFVLDIAGVNAVYMFGKRGEFKRRIGRIGRGPGEYNEISDLNLYNDTIIEIYDSGLDKIIQYDTAGKVVNEIYKLYKGNAHFFHVGDTLGFYRSNGKDAFNLNVIVNDKEYSYLKQEYLEIRSKGSYFYTDDDHVYFTDNYNDTLYIIRNGGIYPYLNVNFQRNKLPEKIRIVEQANQGNYCFDIGNFKFTSRFVVFSFSYRMDNICAFYDRKYEKMLLSLTIRNDIDGIPLLLYENTPNSKDKIVTYLKASIFLRTCESGEMSESAKNLKSEIREDSNPIVVFAYTKK